MGSQYCAWPSPPPWPAAFVVSSLWSVSVMVLQQHSLWCRNNTSTEISDKPFNDAMLFFFFLHKQNVPSNSLWQVCVLQCSTSLDWVASLCRLMIWHYTCVQPSFSFLLFLSLWGYWARALPEKEKRPATSFLFPSFVHCRKINNL